MLKFWKREKTEMSVVASRLQVDDEFLFSSTHVKVRIVNTQDPNETKLRLVITDEQWSNKRHSIYVTLPADLRLIIKR